MARIETLIAGLATAAAIAAGSGCGGAPAPAAPSAVVHTDGFDPRTLDLDRPCTLLRPVDAARLFEQPFFRTVAADRMEGDVVRCSQGVGEGGLVGLAEITVRVFEPGQSASAAFNAICARAPAQVAAPGAAPADANRTGARPARSCTTLEGAVAVLAGDQQLVQVSARGGDGATAPALSARLGALIARRLGAPARGANS